MTVYETIRARLNEEKREGKTDAELAARAGCAQPQINRMLNQPIEYLEKVSLRTIVRLFPDLFATGVSIGNANGTNNVTNVSIGKDNSALIAAIINDDTICDKCKIKVLKMLAK